jgi:hypothetical protein
MKLTKPRRPNALRVREALGKRRDPRVTLRRDDREYQRAARKRVLPSH